ncbi:MAG: low molecular weight phosphotyrosine protein phosphatase [Clostridium sp.]|nr:low molecular weight phosphotyrosine protein phosphatase [Clostridium sp.]
MMENKGKEYKILFVCLGNICRSPAAEGVLKAKLRESGIEWAEVDSAGTGDYHIGDLPDIRMRRAAADRGIMLDHRCRQAKAWDFEEFDMIIGMDANNMRNLRRLAPTAEAEKKLHSIGEWLPEGCGYDHVPDPYYEGREGFELALDLLEMACDGIVDDLRRVDIG